MNRLTPETIKLHELLIRHARGMIAAWEEWIKARSN